MSTFRFAVLPGDGIGPEVMGAALDVLEKANEKNGDKLSFSTHAVGGMAIDNFGTALPDSTIEACRNSDAILFGSVGGPKWEHLPPKDQPERAALLPLRKIFKLFANIRPGLLYPQLVCASSLKNDLIPDGIDMVCIRELTGGIYFGEKKTWSENGEMVASDTMSYRVSEIERIADVAGRTAMGRRGRVCSIDKANVLETSVLWRKTVSRYFKSQFPQIELTHLYVDNAAMQLARNPNQFDVLLTENMFGDILSDEMSVICGSLGMLCSASLGDVQNSLGLKFGLYEPAGGSAPDIAGCGIANPCAQILSAAMMMRHSFGRDDTATAIEDAVRRAVCDGFRTADIAFGKKNVSTTEMTRAVIERL